MITLEQIRTRLIEAIRQSGLTQTEIAKRLNISQSNVAHYLRSDIMPALDTFANLCVVRRSLLHSLSAPKVLSLLPLQMKKWNLLKHFWKHLTNISFSTI